MISRLSKETLNYFVDVLQAVGPQQMVTLWNEPEGVPGSNCFMNLGVSRVDVTRRKYALDGSQALCEGIAVTGTDYDDNTVKTVFSPHLTLVKVQDHKDEQTLGGALAGVAVGLLGAMLGGEEEKPAKEYKFDLPREPKLQVNYSCASSLEAEIAKDTNRISDGDRIVNIKFSGGLGYYDMLVTKVTRTPDGIILAYRDLADTTDDNRLEILLRLLRGESGLPTPGSQYHWLLRDVEKVNARHPVSYASLRLTDNKIDITSGPYS